MSEFRHYNKHYHDYQEKTLVEGRIFEYTLAWRLGESTATITNTSRSSHSAFLAAFSVLENNKSCRHSDDSYGHEEIDSGE